MLIFPLARSKWYFLLKGSKKSSNGFTILEVLVVLAILSLVSVLTIPAISARLTEPKSEHLSAGLFALHIQNEARLSGEAVVLHIEPTALQSGSSSFFLDVDSDDRFEVRVFGGVATGLPRLVIYPNGGVSGGSLLLVSSDKEVIVFGKDGPE